MIRKILLLFLLLGNLLNGISQEHLEHKIWDNLVSTYVTEEGKVNYKGFVEDEAKLDQYLDSLSAHHPDDSWTKEDRLSFWINAYNAFTVKLIVKNYPVKSIKDLGGSIYKVNTPWDIKFIQIGNETYDLNNIEHGIIRKKFEEPRIHFAVNCASVSCPRLRNEAYVGKTLNEQLDDQARYFINNPDKNKIEAQIAYLSKIFNWFSGDFKSKYGSVINVINLYSVTKVTKKTKVYYLDYDWNLNE